MLGYTKQEVNGMSRCFRQKGRDRLSEALTFKLSSEQRSFLERKADEFQVSLGDATRLVLDAAMSRDTQEKSKN